MNLCEQFEYAHKIFNLKAWLGMMPSSIREITEGVTLSEWNNGMYYALSSNYLLYWIFQISIFHIYVSYSLFKKQKISREKTNVTLKYCHYLKFCHCIDFQLKIKSNHEFTSDWTCFIGFYIDINKPLLRFKFRLRKNNIFSFSA